MKKYLFTALFAAASYASAAPIFVGNWEVDQGPSWTSKPLAYTGQQAAALLFSSITGDSDPTHYVISTVGSGVADIDNSAWYSILGYGGGTKLAQDYVSSNSSQAPGYYFSGNYSYPSSELDAASAYVLDNAIGSSYQNYAFYEVPQVNVPEPASLALIALGAFGFATARRKSTKKNR